MPESFRERVDTASSIKSILDSYPFGNGLLRELLQNSDDAGATSQTFILDARTHGVQSLLDPALKETQGPSLLAVNNSVFKESDWKALRTIHGSNKTSDETKIGKYGLGFRSCYHITDTPHILSGKTLVIFDPHEEFLPPNDGGLRIDFVAERNQCLDQLEAFTAAVTDSSKFYPGTVVRLPLRTAPQAARSKIKAKEVTVMEVRDLFSEMTDKELDVVGLFLKSIASIELRVITRDNREVLVGRVDVAGSRSSLRGSEAREESFKLGIEASGSSTTWRILHSVLDAGETSKIISERLPKHRNVGDLLKNDKLFSHVALAFPLDIPRIKGRLFTLLPLPIYTNFPIHVHGILALTPDRQNLRNSEETGMSPDSRERLLIGWNQAIFETFVPSAWSKLLHILIEEDECVDIWSAWPPPSPPGQYWGNLLEKMLGIVIATDSCIFPKLRIPHRGIPTYVTLSSSLVASSSDDPSTLNALALAGVSIVQPPQHIFDLLKMKFQARCRRLNPLNVHGQLSNHVRDLELLDAGDKNTILNYLTLSSSPHSLDNTFGLPLIPMFDHTYAVLRRQPHSNTYILASDEENDLFGEYDEMIALSKMSAGVQQLLCNPQTAQLANVTVLDVNRVNVHLHQIFGRYNPALDDVDEPGAGARIDWLVRFWAWMDSWSGARHLLPHIERFHLLPTGTQTLRKVQTRILLQTDIDPKDIAALKQLGIRFLHPDVLLAPSSILLTEGIGLRSDDIPTVIQHMPQDIPSIDPRTSLTVQNYFVRCLRNRKVSRLLGADHIGVFRKLPIFPILVPNPDNGKTDAVMAPATGKLVFVDARDCPLPLQDATYMDVSNPTRALALLIDPKAVRHAFNEIKILEHAILILEGQPLSLRDALISRIIPRILDLSKISLEKLRNSRFVPAQGSSDRFAPNKIIDPESELAPLYHTEGGKFPGSPFRTAPFLPVMRYQGFFQKSLTPELVLERIEYISTTPATSNSQKKARLLLRLLDKSWGTLSSLTLPSDVAWLPVDGDNDTLYRGDQCRDIKDSRYLFDLALRVVTIKLESLGLRAALGWDQDIAFHVLQRQLQSTLNRNGVTHYGERLMFLIKYMASSYAKGRITKTDIEGLKGDIGDNLWIPVTPREFTSTRHAILSAEFKDVGPFRKVARSLFEDTHVVKFLSCIGCTEQPTPDNILYELERLSSSADNTDFFVSQALQLLEQMAGQLRGHISDDQRKRIFVPDCENAMRRIDDVYYDDQNRSKVAQKFGVRAPAHAKISKSLASGITLQFLSALELGENDDEDDVDDTDMEEDLCTRIEGILKDQDINYALNEFLANAADAGASRFSILLDTQSFESTTILSPEMAQFQQGPSLILHNDAIFAEKDFVGLRKIGKGGKSGDTDTIGRFGLGALSLFHFTEVSMLISGRYVMILDPSGMYLPRREGKRRTALRMKLSVLARKYPHQVSVFESLFMYSTSMTEYNGTLFRLPLRKAPSPSLLSQKAMTESTCLNLLKGQYCELAYHALFFTSLSTISAQYRSTQSLNSNAVWSVSAKRTAKEWSSTDGFDHQNIYLSCRDTDGSNVEDAWLITGSTTPLASVPEEHHSVPDRHKFTCITVRMALHLTERSHSKRSSFLFSSLRLPVTTSLPIHLHAQFALAPDRRVIRFDSPGRSNRIPESAYNVWILSELVPRLYMFTLHRASLSLASRGSKGNNDNFAWWPHAQADPISGEVVEAFYRLLPKTKGAICSTITRDLVSPAQAVFSIEEPPVINRLLLDLRPPNYVYLPPELKAFARKHLLPTVTAEFLRTTIQNQTARFLELWRKQFITIGDVDAVIQFLLDNKTSPLGLHLLLLSDDSLASFMNAQDQIVYHSDRDLTELFPPSQFLHRGFQRRTVDLLISDNTISIQKFDSTGVLSLIRKRIPQIRRYLPSRDSDAADWINLLWRSFDQLPGPFNPDAFRDLALLPVCNSREYVSLDLCRQGCLISGSLTVDHDVEAIAQKLGILVIQKPPLLFSSLLVNKKFSLATFLESLDSLNPSLSCLSRNDFQKLAHWIRLQSFSTLRELPRSLKATVARLPIWPAQRRNTPPQLLSAADLKMLPPDTPIEAVSKYLDDDVAIASHSPALSGFLYNVLDREGMTSLELIGHLRLPDILPASELVEYRAFLNVMLRIPSGGSSQLMVPDGNLRLTPVSRLYDHSILLLSSAFKNMEATLFVHSSLWDLQLSLRPYGLQHEVSFDVFLACATEIGRVHNNDDTLDSAEAAYAHYCSVLPPEIMTNGRKWRMLDSVRFIPRLMERRPYLDEIYDVTAYCEELPAIVAPEELLRKEFEAIAWTQRGLFREQPHTNLIAVNPSLGEPRVEEVVAHLLVLSGDISSEHRGSNRLLKDIHETYIWLNEHVEEASPVLLSHMNDQIFLNLSKEDEQTWTWKSAGQLVFNALYDSDFLEVVRDFLSPFKDLLLAAGVHVLSNPTYHSTPSEEQENFSRIRNVFNAMREAGELTDVILKPEEIGEFAEVKLRAHKSFLAATIPHMKEGFLSGLAESESGEYPFPGSVFGALAVLEFTYTGNLNVEKPQSSEDAMDLLRDLLELLAVADSWDLQDLKEKAGCVIASEQKLVGPDTYKFVMEHAVNYNAPQLSECCRRYGEENRPALLLY